MITGTAVSRVTIVRLGRTGSWVWPARPAGPAAWDQTDAITASGTQTVQYSTVHKQYLYFEMYTKYVLWLAEGTC